MCVTEFISFAKFWTRNLLSQKDLWLLTFFWRIIHEIVWIYTRYSYRKILSKKHVKSILESKSSQIYNYMH